jgi:hypothetical protein
MLHLQCHTPHEVFKIQCPPLDGMVVKNAASVEYIGHNGHMQLRLPSQFTPVFFQKAKRVLNNASPTPVLLIVVRLCQASWATIVFKRCHNPGQ